MVKITLGIDGMACSMCEAHMNDAIRNAFKVKKVTSSHKSKETVIISENDIPEESIKAIVDATGYELTSFAREPYNKKGWFSL
ncbi:MAG: heavy-metal-associated domain-containing protein [Peptostreptococcaceae bacterium]|nr:heavy-metal-associated domain-containing protein [Peptostreptococcaceae bacterium]MDY5739542.1 heavy-metal-associated domain-containing protein [Anaerovoracaceae bacterium]